ncbi:MAG: chondroitinase-B domain-containing protein [Melioribacteraceae bacterium]
MLYTLVLFCTISIKNNAKSFPVKSASEITAAMKNAIAGDTLIMQKGIWNNQKIVFDGNGTESANIYLIAEEPGQVILNGNSTLRIKGKYLTVDGLRFYGGYSSSGAVIEFRNSSSYANNCRVTNCAIIDYNPPSNTTDYKWISIYGTNNRVDHCYLKGKTHSGTTLVVWLDKSTVPNYHRIDHNYFGERPELGVNGGETIRIGDSNTSIYSSKTLVENNYFERCNGEVEIISNKSDENVYRYNTFFECEGGLTLRHGDNCSVYGNFFFGNNKPMTSGVRIIASGHKVYNNYFQDLDGNSADWRGAIVMMNGLRDTPLNGYFQVDSAIVAFNTIVNCKISFLIGSKKEADPKQDLTPKNSTFANNAVLSGSQVFYISTPPENFFYEGNIIKGDSLGIDKPDGINLVDPKLALANDGLWRPENNSPLISAAIGNYDFVINDIDGQNRTIPYDIGADEVSSDAIINIPMNQSNTGPNWDVNKGLYSINIWNSGSGKVDFNPSGGVYLEGSTVTLTAIADAGWKFKEWGGMISGNDNPISFIMDKNYSITSVFEEITSVEDKPLINEFRLEQNYPNPFNPTTEIVYQIAKSSQVTLQIFDLLGKKVADLVNREQAPGLYNIQFSAIEHDLSNGVYFYTLQAGNQIITKKLVLLK